MNWLSCEPPKNSLIAATTGRMLISSLGVAFSGSTMDMRSRTTRSMRNRPTRNCCWMSSPTARTRRLPRWSMSSALPLPLFSSTIRDDLHEVVLGERARLHRDVEPELAIQLVPADLREVVAAEVEEQR